MAKNKFWVIMQKQDNYKKKLLKMFPTLDNDSGIYFLTRMDERGFKFAYIGQAKKVLNRLVSHCMGYKQHIDKSIRDHKWIDDNPYGWKIEKVIKCGSNQLDDLEEKYIKEYADMGYQLRNTTSGGQDKGHTDINERKASRGYQDGLEQGYKNAIRDIKEYFDKYLRFTATNKPDARKKDGQYKELYVKKYNEFKELLYGKEE
jgi:hypothetical protein